MTTVQQLYRIPPRHAPPFWLAPERPITVNEAAWRSITLDERTLIMAGFVAIPAAFACALAARSLIAGEIAFMAVAGLLMIVAPARPREAKLVYAEPEFFIEAHRVSRSLRLFCAFTVVLMVFCASHVVYSTVVPG